MKNKIMKNLRRIPINIWDDYGLDTHAYAGNIINTLMSISKIDKRDTLSEFNLINI